MQITSRQNEKIRSAAKLSQKKYREHTGCFLIEGQKLLAEAVCADIEVETVFYTPRFINRGGASMCALVERCVDKGAMVYEVNDSVMKALSSMTMPEGIVAVAKKMHYSENLELQNGKSYVILEDVQDPGNVGTIIRTADAAGFNAVYVTQKTADIYNEKVLRASMGSVFHLPVFCTDDLARTITTLKTHDVYIAGTSLAGSVNPWKPEAQKAMTQAVALVLGNEAQGMAAATAALCDGLYRIPIYGKAESLNVSIAAGILMYDIARALHND